MNEELKEKLEKVPAKTYEDFLEQIRNQEDNRTPIKKFVDDIQYLYYESGRRIEHILARKHKLEKEHRAIGLNYWDRPPLRFDGFAADSVLAWVMYPILVRFRDSEKMGTPMEFYNEETGYCDDTAWQEVLNKITLAFELKIVDDWKTSEEYKSMETKIDEGLALFTKYYHNLWD